ncbi:DUF1249 domain-containing protein [Aliikangiella sp. G2MR2-5]|uniref:DUF1249 domain-containing protein n=1 Tax=Aliikangiella sp. G2MR2-5 TaxID=2788943 RepID=UPI0018AB9DB0|nr:DUF1249 domain-containing protein [Aliikangiella sp. G2MR2-5]
MTSTATLKSKVRSRPYQPDLDELLSQCELNYWLFRRLWPECVEQDILSQGTQKSPNWECDAPAVRLTADVTDAARYTTTINLEIESPGKAAIKEIKLIVRLYHDVKMLEVMEGSGPGALKAIYEHNNIEKKPVDEKRQINQFLGECFRACLK